MDFKVKLTMEEGLTAKVPTAVFRAGNGEVSVEIGERRLTVEQWHGYVETVNKMVDTVNGWF